MTTPTNGEKTFGQIYDETYKRLFEDPEYDSAYQAHLDGLNAVAQHAIATSPLVKQVIEALKTIRDWQYPLEEPNAIVKRLKHIANQQLLEFRTTMEKEKE